jgi:hypothetical protein
MIVILLGLLDILTALSIFTLHFQWGASVVGFFTAYLLLKSLLTFKSFAGIIDLVVSFIFIAAIFGYTGVITYIGVVWLIQKGIVSFF